ncbi:uncharacterized protein V6R79_023800 [Siganus canaliculatus]
MASRLTGAVAGKEGPTAGKARVSSKGLFLQTQPLDTSNRASGGPWPPAQLHQQWRPVRNLVPLIKQDTMVFYHARPASNTTLLHFLSPDTDTASQFGTVNTLTPQPLTPCINLKECH